MNMCGVADRRSVAGTVPGGADAEKFAESGDFARDADAADLRNVAANEIDEAVFDDVEIFVGVVKEFAHGDRAGAELAQGFEVADIFGREGVFEEEGTVLLDFAADVDGVDWMQALVHIVKEFDFFAEVFAHVFEKFGNGAAIGGGFEDVSGEMAGE